MEHNAVIDNVVSFATSQTEQQRPYTNRIELIALFTVFTTVSLHTVSVFLEKILRKHKHLSEMLQHLYRELMVLGIVSSLLFALETSVIEIGTDSRHLFETIHILVFFVVLGYTVITIFLMCLSVWISRHWDQLEEHDHSDYMNIKENFERIRSQQDNQSVLGSIFNICLRLRYSKAVEQVAFHDLRLHFMHSNHLSPEFSFARYLRKCKQYVFLQLGDLNTTSWMSLCVLLIVDNFLRNTLFDVINDKTNLNISESAVVSYFRACLTIAAVTLCALSLALMYKTRQVLNEILCHSEMIDFDPVAARYYIDHWYRDNDHRSSSSDDDRREKSISYSVPDQNKRSIIHFRAESAAKQVSRVFKISEWGLGNQKEQFNGVDNRSFILSTTDTNVISESPQLHRALSSQLAYRMSLDECRPCSSPPLQNSLKSISNSIEQISTNMQPMASSLPRLNRVQSVHVEQFGQLDLFWFKSHTFMLRVMQTIVFFLVVLFAVVFRFRVIALSVNTPVFLIVVLAITPVFVLVPLALTVPIFTIIIHVGQLVDLDIVLEARRKGDRRRSTSRHHRHASTSTNSSQVFTRDSNEPAPLPKAVAVRRASTLQLLPISERRRLRLASTLYGRSYQSHLGWIVLLHVAFAVATLEPSVVPAHGTARTCISLMLLLAPTFFFMEFVLKIFYVGGPVQPCCFGHHRRLISSRQHVRTVADAFIVLLSFLCAFLAAADILPLVSSAILIFHLVCVMSVANTGRIMIRRQEEAAVAANDNRIRKTDIRPQIELEQLRLNRLNRRSSWSAPSSPNRPQLRSASTTLSAEGSLNSNVNASEMPQDMQHESEVLKESQTTLSTSGTNHDNA